MKEQIGEKIRRLRKEKRLTQENLHHNQSQVALIEKGTKKGGISNPTEDTLRIIAGNMDMTLEELINETTWVKPEPTIKSKEIAFSPAIVDVEIDDSGNISWSHKSHPLYNEKGEKTEYCPESGRKLIDSCESCGRQVENIKQEYCIGCGEALFDQFSLPTSLTELLGDRHTFDDYRGCNEVIGLLGQDADLYRIILDKLKLIPKIEDYDLKIKQVLQGSTFLELSDSIKFQVMTAITKKEEIPEQVFKQINFYIQVTEAAQKKLKSIILSLDPPKDLDTIDEMKKNLFAMIVAEVGERLNQYPAFGQQSESDPKEKPSLQTLMELLKDVEITEDTEELISKLQSKIDINVKTGEQLNKVAEKLGSTLQSTTDPQVETEDDDSETAAADDTESENKNAEQKDN